MCIRDRLQAVLERRAAGKRMGDRSRVHAQGKGGARGAERVRHVVLSLDLQVAGAHQVVFAPAPGHAQRAVLAQKRGVVAAAGRAHVARKPRRRAHGHVREAALGRRMRAQGAHGTAHLSLIHISPNVWNSW